MNRSKRALSIEASLPAAHGTTIGEAGPARRRPPALPTALALVFAACDAPEHEDELARLADDALDSEWMNTEPPESPVDGAQPPAGPDALGLDVRPTEAPNDDCTVAHPTALDATAAAPTNNCYNAMAPDGSLDYWHSDCYWPRPAPAPDATSPGMLNAAAWLAGLVQAMPIYEPFREQDVTIGTGWMYSDTSRHNALDYMRNGATFQARAVADGTVLFAGYMPSPGNVVIIEHSMPDGSKFRAIYHHLRNGRDADIARALMTQAHYNFRGWTWDPEGQAAAYQSDASDALQALAALGPDDPVPASIEQQWGTNSQTLLVSQGDPVKAGQPIGWVGDTGINSGGVHLHAMFAKQASVRTPSLATETRWVFFDPYGLYAGPSSECYQGFAPTGTAGNNRHVSILSPVPAEFPLTDYTHFQTIFNYFASKGMAARSLASDSSSGWRLAGAFAPASGIPVTRYLQTFAQYQSDYNTWWPLGHMPYQTVGMTTSGAARYTSVYGPRIHGTFTSHLMTATWFDQKFDELYDTHRLADVSLFTENGQLYMTASWRPQAGGGYEMKYNMTLAQLNSRHVVNLNAGRQIVQVLKYAHPGVGDRYAALWHTLTNESTAGPYVDLTADQLSQYRDYYIGTNGMKVKHMSAYGGKHTVIFTDQ